MNNEHGIDVRSGENVDRISRNPLDDVEIGDWYWVKYEDTEYDEKLEKDIKVGEHEELLCVASIGSNYVEFEISTYHGWASTKIHFDDFFSRCREETAWREHLMARMDSIQKSIQAKTQELVKAGKSLYLIPDGKSVQSDSESLLPVKVADEPKQYKKALVKLKDKTMPAITKEIDELAKDYAVTAKNISLSDIVKLKVVKSKLKVVEDKLFTIELYCGLQEDVVQIADGEPAAVSEKIAIRQQMLYMDEETLFDYEDGGMDFKRISNFDSWVVRPENIDRILPERRGIVAFRVRRDRKDYGECHDIGEALIHLSWHSANEQTYLLIRNGQRVYRIASSIDFSPRLIPTRGEIGEEQFKKIDSRYVYNKQKRDTEYVTTETIVTPNDIEYDEHVKQLDAILKQYNRIVILIQGLLDRSMVFHPHPPINLVKPGQIDEWINLVRDEEDGLPCNRLTWEAYRDQLNTTLCVGKQVYVRYPEIVHDKYDGHTYYDAEARKQVRLPRRSWRANPMPKICEVTSIRRDRSAVRVSWPQGELARPKRGAWVPNPKRPGWGHYELLYETDKMLHEWVPVKYVINVSDYTPGDYKMFLCDHALKGKYLKWAPFLLSAENWHRKRKDVQK